jgi:hypothetical protein
MADGVFWRNEIKNPQVDLGVVDLQRNFQFPQNLFKNGSFR